jgi:hypothetical protein
MSDPERWALRCEVLVAISLALVAACGGRLGASPGDDVPSESDGALHEGADGPANAADANRLAGDSAFAEDRVAPAQPAGDGGLSGDSSPYSDASATDIPDVLPSVLCDGGTPDPVCIAYYSLLERCLGLPDALGYACQPTLLETPDADVQAIDMICSVNLERLRQACR